MKADAGDTAMRDFFMKSREVKKVPRKGMVVLVEDDPDAVKLIQHLVGERACLISFESVQETKDRIVKIGFDDVLSVVIDYYLPDGNGVDLAAWLDGRSPGLPMFLISSDGDRVEEVSKRLPNLTPVKKWDLKLLEEALGI